MTATETSTSRWRCGLKTAVSVAERMGLGLIYAFVLAFAPLSAAGLWSRTIV
jgi:hypothetical protein